MFFKISVLKNFAIFTGKLLPVSESLFNKDSGLKAQNFIEKRLQHRCFPVFFLKFLRTPKVAASDYVNVGKPVRLNTPLCKPSLFLLFVYIFWSLNCNMKGPHRKYFSVEVVFYNHSVTKWRLLMLSYV